MNNAKAENRKAESEQQNIQTINSKEMLLFYQN